MLAEIKESKKRKNEIEILQKKLQKLETELNNLEKIEIEHELNLDNLNKKEQKEVASSALNRNIITNENIFEINTHSTLNDNMNVTHRNVIKQDKNCHCIII